MGIYLASLNPMTLVRALPGNVAQGIIWGIMALGVYITFRILDFADLTVDGSLATGGAVAVMLIRGGMNPAIALIFAFLAGMAAGFVTGILHTVFGIPGILASILTQIGLYSVNLGIMGKSNQAINVLQYKLVASLRYVTGEGSGFFFVKLILAAIVLIAIIYWFFGTEIGSALRATGNNEDMIRALGVNVKRMKLLGLMLSNGLVGLSGALVCQHQKYADINMGRGAIVIGLAAIVIGEVLMGRLINFACKLSSVVVGAVIYFLIRALVLRVGLETNDMNLFTAVFVAFSLSVPVLLGKWRARKEYSETGEEDS